MLDQKHTDLPVADNLHDLGWQSESRKWFETLHT